ncbi:MAG: iron-sulfur cluster assembly accessory protein [Armatimonadetes bacterium]|nr:iron-sulfur cluster assembly accessory protein [Armatimonadota bacterium]
MVSLTERAAQEISALLDRQNKQDHALRLWIQGGGCSGYEYGMALDNQPTEEDGKFESFGVTVLVDPQSFRFLDGAEIDFVDTLMGGGFKVENPNAVSACGCGTSFAAKEGDEETAAAGCGTCSSARY